MRSLFALALMVCVSAECLAAAGGVSATVNKGQQAAKVNKGQRAALVSHGQNKGGVNRGPGYQAK